MKIINPMISKANVISETYTVITYKLSNFTIIFLTQLIKSLKKYLIQTTKLTHYKLAFL